MEKAENKRPFTSRAHMVIAFTNTEALRFNHEYIGTEHILLGLVKEGSGVGATVLKNLDIDIKNLGQEVEKQLKCFPDMVSMTRLPQTPRAKKVIEYAIEEAKLLNHNYVGTEHLLLGLLREREGIAARFLVNLGLSIEKVRKEVLKLLDQPDWNKYYSIVGYQELNDMKKESETKTLEEWLRKTDKPLATKDKKRREAKRRGKQ